MARAYPVVIVVGWGGQTIEDSPTVKHTCKTDVDDNKDEVLFLFEVTEDPLKKALK